MRIALIGPELEENLSLRYLVASAEAAGHEARIFDFHRPEQLDDVARAIADWAPEVTGLSMIFTARCREFAALTGRLRVAGYTGHITAGGHFASFNARRLLEDHAGFDSIVHGEGEEVLVDLVEHLDALGDVDSLTWRATDGALVDNPRRRNLPDLDDRPWPTRPDRFQSYLGFPIANLLSGRGCYANCNFCSITAWHRDNGGMRFRQRDVDTVADEMAFLAHERGARIFNFQDDNFFLPTAKGNLARFSALHEALEARGVRRIGIQAKARPDSIDDAVTAKLQEMGLFRLFLGVETDAVTGLETLGRGIQREQNHAALDILRRRKIHTAFNLLMFDPESRVEAIAQNVAFMRQQQYFPLNFCRTEVYSGTPLEQRLRAEGRLEGDAYGYWYRIADPAAELAYQLFKRVFTPRNFDEGGMHHESMKVDYKFHILAHFQPDLAGHGLERRVKASVARLNENSADLMGAICAFVTSAQASSTGAVEATAAALDARRRAFDAEIAAEYRALTAQIEGLAEAARSNPRKSRTWHTVAASAAAAVLLSGTACSTPQTHMCEMAPPPNEDAYEPVARDLQSEAQQRADEAMARIGATLAEQHGMQGQTVTIEMEIGEDGLVYPRAVSAALPLEAQAEADLRRLAGSWHFADVGQVQAVQVTLTFPGTLTTPPPDPIPDPPPTSSVRWLEPHDLSRAVQEVQAKLTKDAQFLLSSKQPDHVLSFVIELDDDGAVVEYQVSSQATLSKRQQKRLEKLVATWTFPFVAHGGRLEMSLAFPRAAVPVELNETHMCEMAPRPIEEKPLLDPGLLR